MTPPAHSLPLPHWTTIGFTGHRTLATPGVVATAIAAAVDGLAAGRADIAGVSSAASGGDTLFAEEMRRRDLPLSLILPFPVERFRADFAADPAA